MRAEASATNAPATPEILPISPNVFAALVPQAGETVWYGLTGSVRLVLNNSDPRDVELMRAIKLDRATNQPAFFDVWDVAGAPATAGPSLTIGREEATIAPNDLGANGVWLSRAIDFAGWIKPIEYSRLAPDNARIMMIDANQIWLVTGGLASRPPNLTPDVQSQFEAWQRA